MSKLKEYINQNPSIDPLQFLSDERLNKLKQVIANRTPTLTVVLENVNDQHNLSAVARSCDAVGILEICLVYHGEQEARTLDKTSSASANKWIDVKYFSSIDSCYEYLRKKGFKIFTTQLSKQSLNLFGMDLTRSIAFVFGNEHAGVSDEAVNKADGNFLIPQIGMIQSLNISVAAAVCLYEAFRQRLAAGIYDNPQLNPEESQKLLEDWAKR